MATTTTTTTTTTTRKKRKKRLRLPNGLGSVHKIGGDKQRRRPWRARVLDHVEIDETTGKAKQKYITIGYYETEIEAIEALKAAYQKALEHATGIEEIYNSPFVLDKNVYDLHGRKVESDKWENGKLPAGIYIIGGRKVYLR